MQTWERLQPIFLRDCHHCPLFAPSVGKPASLRTQVGVFRTHGPLSRLNEGLTQPAITFARGATDLFARALMGAWTDADPRGQVPCYGKTLHAGSYFGKENLRNPLVDAGDTIQQSDGLLIRQRHL